MKKIISLSVFLYTCSLNLILGTDNHFIQALGLTTPQEKSLLSPLHEGFLKHTLIETPHGLIPIEEFIVGDIIKGPEEHVITDISISLVPSYIKVITEHETICVGPDQKFYVIQENTWIRARNLQAGSSLFANSNSVRILHTEKIEEEARVYRLTTSHHTVSVGHAHFLAHNADPVSATLTIGYVLTLHPIVATIGATIALGTAALFIYDSYEEELAQTNPSQLEELQQNYYIDTYPLEGKYYEQRKNELLELKQKFEHTKKGLEIIIKQSGTQTLMFSNDFLNALTYTKAHQLSNKYTSINESKLTEEQRIQLRKIREEHLLHLEQDIIELQTGLAFHLSELVERLNNAFKQYEKLLPTIKKNTAEWQKNLLKCSKAVALKNYETTLSWLYLLETIETRLTELKCVLTYYKFQDKDSVITRTTSIEGIIQHLEPDLAEREKLLKKNKEFLLSLKTIEENFLLRFGINVKDLQKNLLAKIATEAKKHEAQEFTTARNKYKSSPRHTACLACSPKDKNDPPCSCHCKGTITASCGCPQGCPCGKKPRIVNKVTKTDFFNCKRIKDNYQYYQQGAYKLKPRGTEIIKNAHFLKWDHLHNEVEVYNEGEDHLGALDPQTFQLYKPRKSRKLFT